MEDDENKHDTPDEQQGGEQVGEERRREMPQDPPVVVGIGASAGGLRALRAFFEAIPAGTGMTFVVVVHLSPEHESSMAELLQTSAAIPTVQVQEELKATNEELQSINEEYKSTLEELETSKEELQSMNEELKTVNQELKDKVEALSRTNDDLNNLMAATEVATLFLGRDLTIKRFTLPLAKVFNIMPVDKGRPLAHVTHNLRYDGLAEDVRRVLERLIPVEREVQDTEGRDYLLRIMPYRTVEDRIEGVVITLVDITRLKQAQEELRQSQERYRLLIESVREYAIFMTDEEGEIASWNTGAEHLFGFKEKEALGQPIGIIFTEEDRAAGAPQAEMEIARREGQAPDERWHVRKGGERFWGSGILTALYDEEGALGGFAKVLRDNTNRREAAEALRESEERLRTLNETLEERVEERTAELQEATERVRHLASELLRAEQAERHRVAQMLHDDLQQRLYGMQMKLSFARRDAEAGTLEQVLENVLKVEEWLDETIHRTRNLTIDLSPPILYNEGLKEALQWLRAQMKERHGLEVEVEAEESFQMEDEGLRVLLFQIVRELLFNVVKHAGVDRATVELERMDDMLVIRVHDSGAGFEPEEAIQEDGEGGFGLFSIQERLHFVGGRLEIYTAPGEGTRMSVYAPLSRV